MSRKREKKEPEQAVKLRTAKGDRDGGEGGPGSSIYSMQTGSGAHQINQYFLFQELHKVLLDSQGDPLNMLLERIAEVGRQVFRFQRAAVSLLNQEEALFYSRVMIGYGISQAKNAGNGTVPQEDIDKLFGNRCRVSMLYSNGEPRSDADYFATKPERRRLDRRPSGKWEHGDVLLVFLKGEKGETVGFISFDTPEDGLVGGRDLFENIELFGQWTSFAIAQHTQISAMKKHAQRLKRLLVTSNIFKINFNLRDLFNEIVWAIKSSSEFNLVGVGLFGVGLFDRKTGNLEMQAVACDDKIIKNRLLELQFTAKALSKVFRDEYKRSKSYLILKPEEVFRSFKQTYYGSGLSEEKRAGTWPDWGLLIVPIRREKKTIGLLIADDPADSQLPGEEDIKVLETMSNQFGIAIDNRFLYRDVLRRAGELDRIEIEEEPDFQENPTLAIRRMAKRIFRKP
ncbi:MAG: GAF domain-containing protein [Spirochaetes bacterium]|nr:GAF domain-containing protein [Spirochaetota bacterium]